VKAFVRVQLKENKNNLKSAVFPSHSLPLTLRYSLFVDVCGIFVSDEDLYFK
jgi:hypothetical protein